MDWLDTKERFKERALYFGATINELDGVYADFGAAAILIRPSGTEPLIRITYDAPNQEIMDMLQEMFADILGGAGV